MATFDSSSLIGKKKWHVKFFAIRPGFLIFVTITKVGLKLFDEKFFVKSSKASVKTCYFRNWNLTEITTFFSNFVSWSCFIEVEHGYASSLPGPFILDPESYTQTRDLKQVTSSVIGAPSNNRRLKSINRKPQGNR